MSWTQLATSVGLPSRLVDDVATRENTLALARALGAPAILSRFSRIVIDPNRAEKDPTLVRRIYDRSVVEGNRSADAAEVQRRIDAYFS